MKAKSRRKQERQGIHNSSWNGQTKLGRTRIAVISFCTHITFKMAPNHFVILKTQNWNPSPLRCNFASPLVKCKSSFYRWLSCFSVHLGLCLLCTPPVCPVVLLYDTPNATQCLWPHSPLLSWTAAQGDGQHEASKHIFLNNIPSLQVIEVFQGSEEHLMV